ncbi:MAG TPA: hypothetical protein VJI73_02155 [Candidatus Paceibacterota bacterium]
MQVLTIPKKLVSDDLVIIPRKEYEQLKARPNYVEGELKAVIKRRLARAHKDVLAGRNLSPVFTSGKEMDKYLGSF